MSQAVTKSLVPPTPEGAAFAGVLAQVLVRYAADVPAAQQSDVERAVAGTLDQIPDARQVARRMTKRLHDLADADRAIVLSPAFSKLPLTHAIGRADAKGALERFAAPAGAVVAAAASTHRYELRFSHLVCKDETNPEFFGSDEIYVVYGWITQEMADQGQPARTVRTPVYGDVDDGDRRPATGSQDLRITGPRRIDKGLVLTATCFEHDLGDVSETMKDVATAMSAASAIASATGFPIISKGLAIASAITSFLGGLAADDQIGATVPVTLTQKRADNLTKNAATVMLPLIDHVQNDGHYNSFVQLRRV